MSDPAAYCIAQEFAAAPQQAFRMDRHYLLYAASGVMRLEHDGRSWTLPPARAALIAAGTEIGVTITSTIGCRSVLFVPEFTDAPPGLLRVFEMSPLARALVLECGGWGKDAGPLDRFATQLFATLATVTWRLAETPSPTHMPVPRNPQLVRAMALTEAQMAQTPEFEQIAAAVAMSPRSLARHFAAEMGMTWRQSLRRLRMIRAVEALADSNLPVTEVALMVGYGSVSAFNAAFRDFVGQTPTQYRASFRP